MLQHQGRWLAGLKAQTLNPNIEIRNKYKTLKTNFQNGSDRIRIRFIQIILRRSLSVDLRRQAFINRRLSTHKLRLKMLPNQDITPEIVVTSEIASLCSQ